MVSPGEILHGPCSKADRDWGGEYSTGWLLPREHVTRGTVGFTWKKCHWHTAGRSELERGRNVQGGETASPKDWTPIELLTA